MFSAARSLRQIPRVASVPKRKLFTSIPFLKKENVPTFGFVTGLIALSVQLVLLYPWHFTLSRQFDELQEKVLQVEAESVRVSAKLDEVMKLEVDVKVKERAIMEASERILSSQTTTQEKIDELIKLTHQKRERKFGKD
mmetsp:Transcript_22960/g.39700  ORF Transcript_22960/g.39700 Transcript_22960/m.39700 type:complete len:139 (-) Transcript_22960:160-576(-)|eukprot:CAMPEP_0184987018 /NCGR_PEP_ID=MMETSP1098-20130426/18546_1 /TAXON_ID=89044 /ORGANISM="Spumella elongata, Strain CCAP 955/1" /LENGTH=138 /DNA_ID=CAMNT_0027511431 /DNA_START=48 /DNA_END=464 /DNA_ORIENTATION=+